MKWPPWEATGPKKPITEAMIKRMIQAIRRTAAVKAARKRNERHDR